MSGQAHTNSVCCLHSTPDLLLSLGLDKSLRNTSLATNELRCVDLGQNSVVYIYSRESPTAI